MFKHTFETAALDLNSATVEAYESKHGVPILATQFHPEYTRPDMRDDDGIVKIEPAYKTHRMILEALVAAGATYQKKQRVNAEIKQGNNRLLFSFKNKINLDAKNKPQPHMRARL